MYGTVNFLTKLCTVDGSGSAFCEWLPDGRHFLTATLSPRLRVDNGFKLWHYSGIMVHDERHDDLYQVAIRPLSVDAFPFKANSTSPPPKPCAAANGKPAPSKPAGAYRPPHARMTTEEHSASSQGDNAKSPQNKNKGKSSQNRFPPGAAPVSAVSEKVEVDPQVAQKRARALQKKLKQINELIEKVSQGEKLSPEQLVKVKQKSDILHELESLNLSSK